MTGIIPFFCNSLVKLLILRSLLAALLCLFATAPAHAASCAPAGSAGAAANGWDTYCWLDMTSYNDATARSASGQAMTFNLSDGSVFNVTVKTVSTAATGVTATTAPAWTGAAIGNTSFLTIPGKPIMYSANNASTITLTMSGMSITPPAGATSGSYMFIVADGESSNNGESLAYQTNGGNWQLLDLVPPISGAVYPTYTNSGTTVNVGGVAGTVGGQIFGSTSPTTVTTTIVAGGLQGVMFAVRFASVRLNKTIASTRLAAADQFTYSIRSTSSGTALSSATSTGTGAGPFTNAAASLASGISITLSEAMAAGSTSTLSQYQGKLSCTNSNAGSPTVLPTNLTTTSYVLGSIAYGDAITCTFVNAPQPRIALSKALSGNRVFNTDQFTVQIKNGATVVASATTTGTGATVSTGTTGVQQVVTATAYTLTEIAAGTTNTLLYGGALSCTNAYGVSGTVLPTTVGGTVTPDWGDNIACTLTNTPNPTKAILGMTKAWIVVSDPVNGTTNPKAIPGALIRYSITVTNTGPGTVDGGTIVIVDPLPTTVMAYVAGTPVTFTDGAVPSGLTWNAATDLKWTKAAGGNSAFTYAPVADANGFDTLVTGIRFAPGTGPPTTQMAGATLTSQPSFTLSFTAQVR
ncbi:hypothetical protein [Sphingomonas sp. SUN039]|uniref:hypothetical protein n=1 Tax=Sphingomonas sp. SUN039 TaxID=2937787 RepID=UPI002164A529|nr:hypothetical protein [Sphingomonas sp. SUN039]UVO55709.1 hypothetical protein M0209_16910 [Sphingomonas sp. SUN039]